MEVNPWTVDEIVVSTGFPNYTVRKFMRGEELLSAAKRMVRSEKQLPYYFRSAAQLLYAISLEDGLKELWEIDNERPAARTHDLSEIFAGLNPNRRDKHSRWYGLMANQAGSSISLDGTLRTNANMVRDFKYGDYDGTTADVVGGEVIGDGRGERQDRRDMEEGHVVVRLARPGNAATTGARRWNGSTPASTAASTSRPTISAAAPE